MTTSSRTTSFTVTHARYLASKVASDLRQMQRFYGRPSDEGIADYILELVILLAGGYIEKVDYGFHVDGDWVLAVSYRVQPDGSLISDDRPGGIYARADLSGASFNSYLWPSKRWLALSEAERGSIQELLPFKRHGAPEYGARNGSWEEDRSYSSGGVGIERKTFKPW